MSPHSTLAPPRAAAIFDVDGTLCDTRSTSSLLWHRRRQDPTWRHALWLGSLLWKAPAAWLADQVDREIADRMVYRQFTGLSLQRLREDARRCCDEVILPACFPEALAEVERHRSAGRRIVLLSGGIDLVLQPLAEALGAELLAQRLVARADRLTGRHLGFSVLDGTAAPPPPSQRAKKGAALTRYAEAAGIALEHSFAYGDSIHDAGMLAATAHPVAVNPDRPLARLAREAGWEVRRWRKGG